MQNDNEHMYFFIDNLPPPAEALYSEPEPDYLDDSSSDFPPPPSPLTSEGLSQTPSNNNNNNNNNNPPTVMRVQDGAGHPSPGEGEEGSQTGQAMNTYIPPSKERLALHKELLMNHRLGKDVLQKPELSKVLEKRKATQKRKEWAEEQANKRTSFELKLEKQANKISEGDEKMKTIEEDGKAPEFVQILRRMTHKTPTSPPS